MSDTFNPAVALSDSIDVASSERHFSFFEYWPGWLFYLPLVFQWIFLGFKYRNMALPTYANPRIEGGGMCGESKISILDSVDVSARHWIAPYTSLVTTNSRGSDLLKAESLMASSGLAYPFVAKPDISCHGEGVKIIDRRETLNGYLSAFPRGARVIFQKLITDEHEAGVFYVRRPKEAKGRVTSVTFKSSPYVVGDGKSTLRTLIMHDPRAKHIAHLYFGLHKGRLERVPGYGERVRLVFVGNHCKGSIFRNGNNEITDAMTDCFDRIAQSLPEFYFGRFDLRFGSLADLREGHGFRLIEINGVGSEATHIWDKDVSLVDAYRSLFEHYRLSFEIGAENRARGHKGIGIVALNRLWQNQTRLINSYPKGD